MFTRPVVNPGAGGHPQSGVIGFRIIILFGLAVFVLAGCGRQAGDSSAAQESAVERRPMTVVSPLRALQPDPSQTEPAKRPEPELQTDGPIVKLPVYELKIAPKDLIQLDRNAYGNQTVPATFRANGGNDENVRVRYRGAWSRSWPKKPLKIFFDKDKPFEGQHCLNLNSGWHDPALVRECLAFHVYAACGVPAPHSRMVRVNLNGQFRGLYVQVEQPDHGFLKEFHLKGASVYKAVSRSNQADERDLGSEASYQRHYEKQTKKQEGYQELQQFCQELARTADTLDFFTRRVDLDEYINYLAGTVLTQNWDGYNKNHFLVWDGEGSKKWLAVPWDLDRTFGDHWNWSFSEASLPAFLGTSQSPGVTGWNRLEDRFFNDPVLRRRFLDRLSELLEKEFTTAKLFPILDRLEAEIGSDAALDRSRWPSPNPDVHSGIVQVKRFIERRRAYLLRELPGWRRQ